ncbi:MULTISPECIES: response regulator transcription factor [Clostridium]|uniref:Stage 0 sporulation protein A homolog n=2 Tax=Clostridium TaxID=1485 RepID=D8GNR9_CLOLD|nr:MULTISPECIES: response regulator transcription factor [Clostridium]ADK13765.1 predicted transcriptional regulator [Clostridium ljungdahlii DSM 13528]AGY76992.1 response regulator transcription factor [Clostridium autoethanogenum DSM 10061]ALU37135.1 Two component transcriptional regulator winged helix family [Clostridium autoethanogenum DSM 10061]OAA85012.1 Alkaline phosphatase synthesis transcriptional regulatory protein PhoP [Clostridium ljungdahlii DSM 13528]OVY50292.1 Alkaline phosphata
MKKVLIVEDEASIRGFLKINFKRNKFIVIEASTGERALEKARVENPIVTILDVMLPGMDGFKTCEILRREFPKMGIIMLTARSQDTDKIMGFGFGADDYVIKPFNPQELIARVNALLRRIGLQSDSKNEVLVSGEFKIDEGAMKVYRSEQELELTPKEYMLMKIFIENQGKALNRNELLNLVWGYSYPGDAKIVDVNIRRLREKIEENSSKPKYIETVWGVGYRWRKE